MIFRSKGRNSKITIILITKRIILIILALAVIRSVFFDIFYVPSDSMKNTLNEGNLIVINKTLYQGILSHVFSLLKLVGHPGRNAIVVFKINEYENTYYVKRCIGIPGDTLEMTDEEVKINSHIMKDEQTVRRLYRLWYRNYDSLENAMKLLKIDPYENDLERRAGHVSMFLDFGQKTKLCSLKCIDSITTGNVNELSKNILKNTVETEFGPLIIPYKGFRIKVDSSSLLTYGSAISLYEGIKIEKANNHYSFNGKRAEYFCFTKDYYFMMGDNRDESVDSRVFGFIPYKNIIGKLICIF